ncbi:citramalate synthase [Stieleria sp. JC731]|uniref:citramalate synthase n=1 Tax=Pirellulaceae TaxID=2691357 RepID=UPI001E526158|nr:citramalate synthase [Stieleria sp. JC731]MCC9601598.1 citramalate synthase [Stieleria sp. JC731]
MTSKSIQIYDTTLRDGSQGEGVSFSLNDKIQIALRLAETGVDFIEGGYPLSNEKDVAFFENIRKHDLGGTKVCAFGMTRRRSMKAEDDPGMQALVAAQTPVITVVGKTWDYHATEVLRVSLQENVDMIGESVAFLKKSADVIYDAEHFFDGYRANPEYAIETLRAAAAGGATTMALCDTNGGSLPEQIAEITKAAMEGLKDFPEVIFGIHCHNDSELAVANSLAAVDVGAMQVQGTINGIGERCGNADLLSVIGNLALKKKGYTVLGGKGLQHLTELSRFVYETANLQWRGNQPFVGQSAFAHKGGMHVHAINKAASTYEHINPELVGNERRILVSELSGRSNIAAVASQHSIENDREVQDKILSEVVRLENQGFQYENAAGSFDLLIKRTIGSFTPHFSPIKYRVVAGETSADEKDVYAEAILKIRVGDQDCFAAAEGHGPVNALDSALRQVLLPFYPSLREMHLVDYKVRIFNNGSGTAAGTRVNIESADQNESWGTIGVSDNIIEASFQALIDSVEYKLHKDNITPAT